jgi:hypothetical protein
VGAEWPPGLQRRGSDYSTLQIVAPLVAGPGCRGSIHTVAELLRKALISLRTIFSGALRMRDCNAIASTRVFTPIISCGVGVHFAVNGNGMGDSAAESPLIATQYNMRASGLDVSSFPVGAGIVEDTCAVFMMFSVSRETALGL